MLNRLYKITMYNVKSKNGNSVDSFNFRVEEGVQIITLKFTDFLSNTIIYECHNINEMYKILKSYGFDLLEEVYIDEYK